MKPQGDLLFPIAQQVWDRGSSRFFNKGTNGRWPDVFSPGDLARYDHLVVGWRMVGWEVINNRRSLRGSNRSVALRVTAIGGS
jgi:hypothetical protein